MRKQRIAGICCCCCCSLLSLLFTSFFLICTKSLAELFFLHPLFIYAIRCITIVLKFHFMRSFSSSLLDFECDCVSRSLFYAIYFALFFRCTFCAILILPSLFNTFHFHWWLEAYNNNNKTCLTRSQLSHILSIKIASKDKTIH